MAFDYTSLLKGENSLIDSWRELYDESLSLPQNLSSFIRRFIILPKDYYDIVTAYLFIPAALSRIVPYLFLFGQSGTGKTTLGKLASYWYGVPINTSSDTYAAIRNCLSENKYQDIEIPSKDPDKPSMWKRIPTNKGMVWDDMDASVFNVKPDLYRLFKVGYDSSTSKISIAGENRGENITFDCFCTKMFSSISPIHLDAAFKELRRRLIVIPFARVEDIPDDRLAELGVTRKNWHKHLLDLDSYDWKGFSDLFANYWDTELAEMFLITRKTLAKENLGLSSQQKAISLDLLTTGIVTGIWHDEYEGISRLKTYFDWFKTETSQYGGISKYLKDYIAREQRIADEASNPLAISSVELMQQVRMWLNQGWILEKPRPKQVKALMADFGMVLYQGYWVKRK